MSPLFKGEKAKQKKWIVASYEVTVTIFCIQKLRETMKKTKPGKLVPPEIETRYLPNTATLFY
jgi:hypothetical protein